MGNDGYVFSCDTELTAAKIQKEAEMFCKEVLQDFLTVKAEPFESWAIAAPEGTIQEKDIQQLGDPICLRFDYAPEYEDAEGRPSLCIVIHHPSASSDFAWWVDAALTHWLSRQFQGKIADDGFSEIIEPSFERYATFQKFSQTRSSKMGRWLMGHDLVAKRFKEYLKGRAEKDQSDEMSSME
jgi:hypothetical protein